MLYMLYVLPFIMFLICIQYKKIHITHTCTDLTRVLGLFKIPALNRHRAKLHATKHDPAIELVFQILFLVYLFNYNLDCFNQKQKSHQKVIIKKIKTLFSKKNSKNVGALKMAALNQGMLNRGLNIFSI